MTALLFSFLWFWEFNLTQFHSSNAFYHPGEIHQEIRSKLSDMIVKLTNGNKLQLSSVNHVKGSVFVFINPACPISTAYLPKLNSLNKEFSSKEILFYAVISGSHASNQKLISYINSNHINFQVLIDESYQLANYLRATNTPEVFVVGSDEQILYQGKIDNWYYGIGKRRKNVSEHYLKDALDSILSEKLLKQQMTEPLGCEIFSYGREI